MKTKKFLVLALLAILTLVVSACAPAAGVPGAAPAAPLQVVRPPLLALRNIPPLIPSSVTSRFARPSPTAWTAML